MLYTQSMLDFAISKARNKAISEIHVSVGELSSIVPESMEVIFVYLREDTLAADANLRFYFQPVIMRCKKCEIEFTIISKDSLIIKGMDVSILRIKVMD